MKKVMDYYRFILNVFSWVQSSSIEVFKIVKDKWDYKGILQYYVFFIEYLLEVYYIYLFIDLYVFQIR